MKVLWLMRTGDKINDDSWLFLMRTVELKVNDESCLWLMRSSALKFTMKVVCNYWVKLTRVTEYLNVYVIMKIYFYFTFASFFKLKTQREIWWNFITTTSNIAEIRMHSVEWAGGMTRIYNLLVFNKRIHCKSGAWIWQKHTQAIRSG